jgi:pimeloyl-ACP methyl ester carboxylesterase
MDIPSALKVTGMAVMDRIGSWMGRPPLMVDTSGKPGSAALMTAPDAEPGYLGLVPERCAAFRNQVAARVALDIPRHFPGRKARNISCPVLFCVCDKDSVAPAKATLRHARNAPGGEIRVYPNGHFDIYVGEPFERVVSDQVEFLQRHVPPLN